MITLTLISPNTALIFKTVRLRALQDSPLAFSSTFARESLIPDSEWFQRSVRWSSEGSIGYLAFNDDSPCGMVACYAEEEDPARAHVVSMWVDSAARRTGTGTALINALVAWATGRAMRELKLMVTGVNQGAIDFYLRLGFKMSGNSAPYPNDASITEFEMILSLPL